MALRFLTAGESHGPGLTAIVEGLPAGLPLSLEAIDADLARRQRGYGRGARMGIERDRVEIRGGLIDGRTIGSPLALWIRNLDWENRKGKSEEPVRVPRPGHADLAGCLKYGFQETGPVSERSSARETAARVAVGAVARRLLAEVGVGVGGFPLEIAGIDTGNASARLEDALRAAAASPAGAADPEAERTILARIDRARDEGETLGGVVQATAWGVPAGLGSYVHWDRRLDGRIAQALISIPTAKAVEIGDGVAGARVEGSRAHDDIEYEAGRGFVRPTNRAGGIEGGVTNGEPVRARIHLKPLSTLRAGLPSVDLVTGEARRADYQRSDVCVVPAAAVVAEAMLAWVLAEALLERFGGDTLDAVQTGVEGARRAWADLR